MSPADISCLETSGDGWECMISAWVDAFATDALLGLVIGGMLVLAFYIASGYHPAPPAIGTMAIGGALIPILPPQYRGMAQVVMLLGFIVGVFVALRRYSLEVGR